MMKLARSLFLPLTKQHFNKNVVRCNSTQSMKQYLVHLDQRSLLRLSGNEVSDFLQGLITNDMKHLTEGASSIYSAFLNIKGRVLYDTIIYKTQEDDVFYIECDNLVVTSILKHLKMYKLRRKVEIQSMQDDMKVYSVYCNDVNSDDSKQNSKDRGIIFPCGTSDNKSIKLVDDISIYSDPRLAELGLRILTKSNVDQSEILKHLESNVTVQENSADYRAFRYQLGIAEGVQELPAGVPFPLEINCDYLHGVSFHKGCYIGQELTARTHHTGVVRKRLMPLTFDNDNDKPLEYDEKITNEAGKVVGKIIGQESIFGLGLIRIAEALAAKTLTAKNKILKVTKPLWWPQESQKMEASLKTNKN